MARVHHLNCGTMCPRGARMLAGEGGWLAEAHLVAHCLLIESGGSLTLVDTGFGLGDATDPGRLGQPFRALVRPRCDAAETASRQIEALGLDPADVRDIVVTHLDLDHAGGLGDFPQARVHAFAPELEAALHPSLRERARYVPAHWAHEPEWVRHTVEGDDWFGFESVRLLPDLDAEVALVPLLGHSAGHSGVAVGGGDGWLLHCGDAFFHRGQVATPPSCPPGLRAFQALNAHDGKARGANTERLRRLAAEHGGEVRLICSHDPVLLDRVTAPG
ncbi:MAG: MBL fold metallo-hydrolase [Actinobacteria bacterium]|nr:MBL fold metallo-hydrolase [Actinomycetota bacterium]